ncbi:hypothetical protein [Photorhabdus caribbeanensis]|uniref:hypothetical protein n=1 Tax=Photorhabdus caribbeanensis TaxID=1004165 RepID=UPI001BD4B325|nr:hypothetical protein [Photorhabdus caribbeanensis]
MTEREKNEIGYMKVMELTRKRISELQGLQKYLRWCSQIFDLPIADLHHHQYYYC